MHNVMQLCLAANKILLMRKRNQAFLLLARKMADRIASLRIFIKNQTWSSNDIKHIGLGYHKIT